MFNIDNNESVQTGHWYHKTCGQFKLKMVNCCCSCCIISLVRWCLPAGSKKIIRKKWNINISTFCLCGNIWYVSVYISWQSLRDETHVCHRDTSFRPDVVMTMILIRNKLSWSYFELLVCALEELNFFWMLLFFELPPFCFSLFDWFTFGFQFIYRPL